MSIKLSKREKIHRELNQSRNNPKKFWENINSVLSKEKRTSIKSLKDEDGPRTYEGQELPELINSYFANIGKSLADNILNENLTGQHIHHLALQI